MPWSFEQHRKAAVNPTACLGRNERLPHMPFTRSDGGHVQLCAFCLQRVSLEADAWTTRFIILEDAYPWT